MTRRGALASLLAAGAFALAVPARAEPSLANAWMRPAHAGQAQARVYVDIRSSTPLRLVGAASPVAKAAQLVSVEPPGPDTPPRVVQELPLAAAGETRLAYLGSHVRLLDVVRDVGAGDRVPLELVFVDAAGRRVAAATEIAVRGLMPRRPGADGDRAPDSN